MSQESLTPAELLQQRNRRTGMTIFQISWILVFVCLVIVNWQLRGNHPSWPPPGVSAPSALLPGLVTLGLLASAWLARAATRNLAAGRRAVFRRQWRAALGLGALFVLVMAYEWLNIPTSGIYSDVFRMMTAFHLLHALAIGLFMSMIARGAAAGRVSAQNLWPAEGATSLWYFVVVAWLLFFPVLYLI